MLFLLRNARYVKVVRQVFAFFRVSEQELTEMVIRKMSQHEEFAFDHNTFIFIFSSLSSWAEESFICFSPTLFISARNIFQTGFLFIIRILF